MRGTIARAVAPAVLAAVVLTGCGPSDGGTSAEGKTGGATARTHDGAKSGDDGGDDGPSAGSRTADAARGGSVGGAGSACPLPVTFDHAADWTPEAVSVDPASELAELAQQGPLTMACEIDAKPAGHIGYLRVWTGAAPDDARKALEAFLAADENAGGAAYAEFEAGGLRGVEVTYTETVEVTDETKTERAFAVASPDGPVVVHLGGLDTAEHEAMLPAYELAKRTVRVG
ncbi:lipoprotein [uncultured Streptomyces sp.]|uniref:lipoprotein n=1 Tax=uncultured Streptomyces sp. TaxID=174707 RepID=UPI002605C212|nr:lipoprotein [uncultured Streptomyces sp.]